MGKQPIQQEQRMSEATMVATAQNLGKRGMRWLIAGLVLAVSATVALSAWAQHGPGGHGHGGMMGGPGMFMGSPEHIDHMLDRLNASDAQRAQIKQIAQQAAADLKAQHEAGRALHERAAQILTAPTIDANAAEAVRQQMMQQHDAASRRMLQAMLDASRVLTPEQRAKIGEQMKQRAAKMQERMKHMQEGQPKQ
jgi:Spy/CpxP family protein refolding chaperone